MNVTRVAQTVTNVEYTVLQECTEIIEVNLKGHSKAGSVCCPDCNKPSYLVPPRSECRKNGCEGGLCADENATCVDE